MNNSLITINLFLFTGFTQCIVFYFLILNSAQDDGTVLVERLCTCLMILFCSIFLEFSKEEKEEKTTKKKNL